MATITVGGASSNADAIVETGFNNAQIYASNAFNEAVQFLNQISAAAAQLKSIGPINGTLTPISATVAPFVKPAAPAAPTDLTLNLPPVPSEPTLTPVAVPALGAAPVFDATPPQIDIPQQPSPLQATVPVQPTLGDVTIPADPNVALPDVPNLIGINVPVEPLLNLPTFTAVLPGSPLAPNYIFNFSEPAYTDQLLTDLKTQLDQWVNGAFTGLDPLVEQALWSQARSR